METFRYALALALLCTFPPMLFYWPVIHGWIRFWRRLGAVWTYVVVLGTAGLGGAALFRLRGELLALDFGTSRALVAVGALCVAVATWLRVLLHRDVTTKLFSGLPELEPERHPQRLVRSGLYARVRHPRYLQLSLALLGYVLVANYLAGYVIWLVWLPALYVITLFEDRELRERFGAEHEEYSREVPRLVPELRRRGGSAGRE